MAKAIHQTAIYNMCAWLGIWEAFHLVIDSYIHVRHTSAQVSRVRKSFACADRVAPGVAAGQRLVGDGLAAVQAPQHGAGL